MSQLIIRGHAPHGHLDDNFSVTDLRKPRPLYNFTLIDRELEKERHQLERRQQLMEHQFCMVGPDNLLKSTELAQMSSHNNSAAGRHTALALMNRHSRAVNQSRLRGPSNRELMESHLRNTYGPELFEAGQYVVRGRVGIAGLPQSTPVTNSAFQAMRGRILGPVPSGTFADEEEDPDNDNNCSESCFEWCDRNNSAEDVAKTCARRAGAKIAMRRGLSKWVFLYFRVRRVSWEFMVYEEKMNCSTVDLFSENVLDRWTVKLRFKMLVDAPMKFPLMAFLSRMGLDTDPDIVFSVDGFFGDMLVGGVRNKNSIPHRQVSFNTTPEAMGLQNGDNIFVVKANSTLRNNVEAHMEMAKRRANKGEGEDEEDEDEDVEEEEEDHH